MKYKIKLAAIMTTIGCGSVKDYTFSEESKAQMQKALDKFIAQRNTYGKQAREAHEAMQKHIAREAFDHVEWLALILARADTAFIRSIISTRSLSGRTYDQDLGLLAAVVFNLKKDGQDMIIIYDIAMGEQISKRSIEENKAHWHQERTKGAHHREIEAKALLFAYMLSAFNLKQISKILEFRPRSALSLQQWENALIEYFTIFYFVIYLIEEKIFNTPDSKFDADIELCDTKLIIDTKLLVKAGDADETIRDCIYSDPNAVDFLLRTLEQKLKAFREAKATIETMQGEETTAQTCFKRDFEESTNFQEPPSKKSKTRDEDYFMQ